MVKYVGDHTGWRLLIAQLSPKILNDGLLVTESPASATLLTVTISHHCSQVYGLCRNRNRLFLFRGWNRLCQHAASVARPAVAIEAKTAVAAEDKPAVNDTNFPANNLRGVGANPHGREEHPSLERRGQIVKHLVRTINNIGWYLRHGAFLIVLRRVLHVPPMCLLFCAVLKLSLPATA